MHDAPNYKKYTISQLHDARRHIDEHEWPERVAEIEREISLRGSELPARPKEIVDDSPAAGWSRRAVGLYLFLSGGSSLAITGDHFLSDHRWALARYGIPLVLYGGMVAAGLLLMRRRRIGLFIGIAVVVVQIPVIQIGRLGYTVMAFPSLETQLWPSTGVGFSATNTLHFAWYATTQPLYLAVNVGAGMATALLGDQIDRLQGARARLRRLRGKDTT